MSEILAYLVNLRDIRNVLDIFLVALLIFVVLRLFQGTQAVQLIRGVLFIAMIALVASQTFDLIAFNWILKALSPAILVALPVIFQPELRRALERIGRTAPLFVRRNDNAVSQSLVNEIARATEQMARRKIGALMVFEGLTGLGEIVDRGVKINSDISGELIETIFFPNTPLHDGAAIIRGDRIIAAGCVLPLAQADLGDSQLGTRHRAGIGVTEQTDAMSVIVSEETGGISVARNGRIVRVDGGTLRRILSEFYRPASGSDKASAEKNSDSSAEKSVDKAADKNTERPAGDKTSANSKADGSAAPVSSVKSTANASVASAAPEYSTAEHNPELTPELTVERATEKASAS